MSDVFLPSILKQRAVYWAPAGQDPITSADTFDDPVEIKCRWEDKIIEYINAKAERTVSNSVVYVDRDLEVGGMLWLGRLEDLEDADEPTNNPRSGLIASFGKIPSINAKKFSRRAIT